MPRPDVIAALEVLAEIIEDEIESDEPEDDQ